MASLTPGAVDYIVNEKMTVAGGHRPVLQVVKFGTITNAQGLTPVSYTHLTLPTKRIV